MKDITSTITKPLAILGENGKGYTKEANFISWNGNAAKLDIREWHPNHERCGKGITLTEDEGRNLYAALKTIYKQRRNNGKVFCHIVGNGEGSQAASCHQKLFADAHNVDQFCG